MKKKFELTELSYKLRSDSSHFMEPKIKNTKKLLGSILLKTFGYEAVSQNKESLS